MSQAHRVDTLLRDLLHTLLLSITSGMVAALLLLLLAGLWPSAVRAAGDDVLPADHPVAMDDPGAGTLRLRLASGGASIDAPTLQTRVKMRVSGLLARVTVEQRFHNSASDWAEGVYLFPLPEQAAVDRLRLRIGERLIEGEIQERQAARKRYQQARQQGQRASLVSQQRPNLFTTAVANIAPGETVSVEIEYQQTLRYDQGELALRFPLVVAPRYIPGSPLPDQPLQVPGSGWALDTDRVPDASRITPPVRHPDEPPGNPVEIEVELAAGMPLQQLASSYHPVQIEQQPDHRYRIRLQEGTVAAERDFVLRWRPAPGSEPRAALFHEAWQGRDYAMLMLMPPLSPSASPRPPRELVLVIDTSGSMAGDSMRQARAAAALALQRLTPLDHFNLIVFNDRARALFPTAVPANEHNRRRALAEVAALDAEGGTEMLPALRMALANGAESGRLRQVIFVTDGSVGNEAELFTAIEQRLGNSRLFTVGIGSAPNSHFMRRAARFGRGSFSYIGDTGEVQQRMQQLFAKLESPMLTDIRVDWPLSDTTQLLPARVPDLYLGEPLLLAVRAEQLPAQLTVSGKIAGRPWLQRLSLAGGAEASGVHLLWARRRIAGLMEAAVGRRNDPQLREQVLAVALEHQLVSRYTSLVAVDRTPARNPEEPLRRNAVPVNLPKGWSAQRVFGVLPQTATAGPWHGLLGGVALLLAILSWCWPWRRARAR